MTVLQRRKEVSKKKRKRKEENKPRGARACSREPEGHGDAGRDEGERDGGRGAWA